MQAALLTGVIVVNPDENRAKEGYVNSVSAAIGEQFFCLRRLPATVSTNLRWLHPSPVLQGPFGTGPAQAVLFGTSPRLCNPRQVSAGRSLESSFSFAGPACDGDQGGLVDGHGRRTRFQQGRSDEDRVLCFTSGGGGAGDEEAIVQIVGIGPVETVLVGPAGAPAGYWPKPK